MRIVFFLVLFALCARGKQVNVNISNIWGDAVDQVSHTVDPDLKVWQLINFLFATYQIDANQFALVRYDADGPIRLNKYNALYNYGDYADGPVLFYIIPLKPLPKKTANAAEIESAQRKQLDELTRGLFFDPKSAVPQVKPAQKKTDKPTKAAEAAKSSEGANKKAGEGAKASETAKKAGEGAKSSEGANKKAGEGAKVAETAKKAGESAKSSEGANKKAGEGAKKAVETATSSKSTEKNSESSGEAKTTAK